MTTRRKPTKPGGLTIRPSRGSPINGVYVQLRAENVIILYADTSIKWLRHCGTSSGGWDKDNLGREDTVTFDFESTPDSPKQCPDFRITVGNVPFPAPFVSSIVQASRYGFYLVFYCQRGYEDYEDYEDDDCLWWKGMNKDLKKIVEGRKLKK